MCANDVGLHGSVDRAEDSVGVVSCTVCFIQNDVPNIYEGTYENMIGTATVRVQLYTYV